LFAEEINQARGTEDRFDLVVEVTPEPTFGSGKPLAPHGC
jgi:hypothetical protein